MRNMHLFLLVIALFIGLWVAYKIGKVILRLLVGLVVLGLIAFVVYRLFLH